MANEERRRFESYDDFHRVYQYGGLDYLRGRPNALACDYRERLHWLDESVVDLFQTHIQELRGWMAGRPLGIFQGPQGHHFCL